MLYTCECLEPGVSRYDHCYQLARYDLNGQVVTSITRDLVTPRSCLDSLLFSNGFLVDESSHVIDIELDLLNKLEKIKFKKYKTTAILI